MILPIHLFLIFSSVGFKRRVHDYQSIGVLVFKHQY